MQIVHHDMTAGKEEGKLGHDSVSRSAKLTSGSPECPASAARASSSAGSPTSATGARKLTNHPTPVKRAVKSPRAQQDLHPVLKLGYQTICEVHCNGLQGLFLGGHDRDLYIQCTSHEYADLPMVDANQGGCIMSCSHFERAAGRELSKKWKESIHVVGEGEGSKATLLAWLKRQAEAISPDIIGTAVWVCWCNEADFYHGTILSFNKESGKHKVCTVRLVTVRYFDTRQHSPGLMVRKTDSSSLHNAKQLVFIHCALVQGLLVLVQNSCAVDRALQHSAPVAICRLVNLCNVAHLQLSLQPLLTICILCCRFVTTKDLWRSCTCQ